MKKLLHISTFNLTIKKYQLLWNLQNKAHLKSISRKMDPFHKH